MFEIFSLLFFLGLICVFIVSASHYSKGHGGGHSVSSGGWIFRSGIEALSNREGFRLFRNVILKTPDGTTEVDYIAVSPYGIFVIETKDFSGWIFGDPKQKKWTQSLKSSYSGWGFYSKNTFRFQNPLHQNYKHVKAVESFLRVNSCFVYNVVVFTGGSTFKTDMPRNVMNSEDFIPYIESFTSKVLPDEGVEEFCQKLREHVSISNAAHVSNIRKNMDNPICPRCGKAMVIRTARQGKSAGLQFWGCVNYPECKMIKNLVK